MSSGPSTEGFGAPAEPGKHHFIVHIPKAFSEPVRITEDFGYAGGQGGMPYDEERAVLERAAWSGIRDTAKHALNARLRAARQSPGSWKTGTTKVERVLGKELCVLAWAAEGASAEQLPIICTRWAALRPEERWWLFAMTAAEAGRATDRDRGWRRALHLALSDGGGRSAAPDQPSKEAPAATKHDKAKSSKRGKQPPPPSSRPKAVQITMFEEPA